MRERFFILEGAPYKQYLSVVSPFHLGKWSSSPLGSVCHPRKGSTFLAVKIQYRVVQIRVRQPLIKHLLPNDAFTGWLLFPPKHSC